MFYPPISKTLLNGYNNTFFIIIYFFCRFCIFQSTYGTFLLSVNRFVSVIFPYKDYHNNKKFLMVFLPFYILLPLYFTWFIIPSTILLIPINEIFSDNNTIFIISYIKPKFLPGNSISKTLYPYLLIMGTIQLFLNIGTSLKLIFIRMKNQANISTSKTKQEHKLIIFTFITYLFQICFIIQNNLIVSFMYDEDETVSDYLVGLGIKLVIFQMFGTLCGLILMSKVLRDKIFSEIKEKKRTMLVINIISQHN